MPLTSDRPRTANANPTPDKFKRSAKILIVIVVGILVSAVCFAASDAWLFSQSNVARRLAEVSSSDVHIRKFRRTFLPYLGCEANDVEFRRGPDPRHQAVLTVKKLTIETSLPGLLTKHLRLMRMEGANVVFPPFGTGQSWSSTESEIVVDRVIADGAKVEFTGSNPDTPPVEFVISQLRVHPLAAHVPMSFESRLRNPLPAGEVSVSGSVGPFNRSHMMESPISGTYSFRQADLAGFDGIAGTLSSEGKFSGPLQKIEVEGTTKIPDFRITRSIHQEELKTAFHATVDANDGAVTLEKVRAQVFRTLIVAAGRITGKTKEDGKTTALDFAVRNGRIQDLVLLFVAEKESFLNGVVSLKAHALLPSGKQPVLKKLKMSGVFGIDNVLFSKEETQQNVDMLSSLGRGEVRRQEDPERVISDLVGNVTLENGVANFTRLSFRVPGAHAWMHGTFDLTSHQVQLHGTLALDAKLAKTTSGMKSFLLKAIDPFLKKNHRGGASFPVSITGTYESPRYHSDPV